MRLIVAGAGPRSRISETEAETATQTVLDGTREATRHPAPRKEAYLRYLHVLRVSNDPHFYQV